MTRPTATPRDIKSALTPKLRFPEFRDGPAWNGTPMGKAYSFKGNNSFSRDQLNYEHGSVKNIHYGDIHTKFSTIFDVTKETVPFINPSAPLDGFRPENDCIEGDMIFADASEDLADIGKSIEIVRLNGERVVSGQHTILARPNDDNLAVGFGAYLFKSTYVRTQIQKESQGSKVLGISATRLTKIQLPIPHTKAEQQKIAECLSTLDELIGAESQKLDALKAHKKGLMQQLFPREGETLPRLRFPEFHSAPEWKEAPLSKFIASLDAGVSVNSGDRPAAEGEIGVLKTSAVTNGVFEPGENKVVSSELEQARLPHGVLFRGGAEEKIRKKLLQNGHIDTVIGLPANLFYSTGIPVCILVLKKCKKPDDVLFINAAEHFDKGKRQNVLTDEHIDKIVETYRERPEKIERYARRVSMAEIEKEGYNLNISRYISTAVAETEIDLAKIHALLAGEGGIEKKIREATAAHNAYLKELGLPTLP